MGDRQSKNNFRWIRFTGDSVSRWSDIIDDVHLRQIPVELIDAIKFITHDGDEVSIKITELLANKHSDHIGEIIDEAIENKRNDLRAVEFLVNFDKLETQIVDAIGRLFENNT